VATPVLPAAAVSLVSTWPPQAASSTTSDIAWAGRRLLYMIEPLQVDADLGVGLHAFSASGSGTEGFPRRVQESRPMQVFQDHWLDLGPHRVRYWTQGSSGPPVILLHGIGCSVLEWNRSLAAFGEHHRVFALDLLGAGASSKPAEASYSLRSLAEFVLAFATQLGLGPVHLAGNSLGGRVALECAIAAPRSVASLLLVDPAGVGRETFINFRLATVPRLGEWLTWPNRVGLRMLWRHAYFDASRIEEERIDAKLADARQPGAQAAFLRTLRGFLGLGGFLREPLDALERALPALTQPTLILWGRQDRLLPVAQGERLAARMPNARLQVIERCGHLPQLEQAEEFNRAALGFWAAAA
jgi:pimeloyl-ACP methyl ester carboxylesterase